MLRPEARRNQNFDLLPLELAIAVSEQLCSLIVG
jgi:hypothetical protein